MTNEQTHEPETQAPADIAASCTIVGLAVVGGDGHLRWSNPAFDALSEEMSLQAEELAARAVAGGLVLLDTEEGYTWRVRRRSSHSGLQVIEAIPTPLTPNTADKPAEVDPTTGLLSRRALDEVMLDWLGAAEARPFALAFLDLDHFKPINDTHGHLVGDQCLREAALRLAESVRSADVVGRFGGDEFVLLLEGISAPEQAAHVERRVRSAFASPFQTDAGPQALGVSMGVAFSGDGYRSAAEMVEAADQRMYAQKRERESG